jgi:hypothetical protein
VEIAAWIGELDAEEAALDDLIAAVKRRRDAVQAARDALVALEANGVATVAQAERTLASKPVLPPSVPRKTSKGYGRANEDRILAYFREHGPTRGVEVYAALEMNNSTFSSVVSRLVKQGRLRRASGLREGHSTPY